MYFVITALAQAGDEVLYPDPGFPTYESVIRFVGATPVPVPLLEERGFAFDLDRLRARIGPRTRLIILNSPQNPTGGVLAAEDLADIAALAQRHGVPVLTDEVYNRFLYEGEFHSIASLPGMKALCVILDGFSKAYAMTGWRLGYGVMPPDLAGQVTRLMVNSNSCTAAFSQVAAIAALRGDQGPSYEMVRVFRRRRDLIVAGLNRIRGVSCGLPRGAFYAFPNVKALEKPAKAIAEHLLTDGGVACLAGTDFGRYGEGYLRFSYATSEVNIAEAARRVGESLARL
jgi:aspartate/methionine/tyrosine aminotransferase